MLSDLSLIKDHYPDHYPSDQISLYINTPLKISNFFYSMFMNYTKHVRMSHFLQPLSVNTGLTESVRHSKCQTWENFKILNIFGLK